MNPFEEAIGTIESWIGPDGVPGAAAVVQFRGEIVAERYAGEAQPGIAVDERTLFALASITKPITAAVTLSCVEDGLLSLEDRAGQIVPEFLSTVDRDLPGYDPEIEARRAEITVRQLLSHLSGLPEDLPRGYLNLHEKPSLAVYTDHFLRLPLTTAPGTYFRYSNAGIALIACIVERVTGGEFWDEADRRIIEPLGLRDIVARPGPALRDRIGTVAGVPGDDPEVQFYTSDYFRRLAIPWGGLYGSARDLVAFADAFMPGRQRGLSPIVATAAITDQVGGLPGEIGALRLHWGHAHWGLGWEVRGDKRRHWTGDLASPATYCHFGAAGTLLWGDPERDLIVALFANRMTLNAWPFRPPRWSTLNDELTTIADRS